MRSLTFPVVVATVLVLAGCACAPHLRAQDGCEPPPSATETIGANMFSPEQEIALGDALAERLQRTLRITDDPAVAGNLQRIGDRLAAHLPPNQLNFRYYLVELRAPNAFSIAGGRIYVSRSLVALTRNEDELADILAHEMGHLVTHQTAVDYTWLFNKVLGVKAVNDRKDVFDKVHLLFGNWRRDPGAFRKLTQEESGHQLVADRVALYVASRAGYSPDSFADVFDRLADTRGKKGDWVSDFLGSTTPAQGRLREMTKITRNLPAACLDRRMPETGGAFQSWQSSVVAYDGWNRREEVHDVAAKVLLEPPLRAPVSRLRFSPDGTFLLAQDTDRISVMTVKPFAFLFEFDAFGALSPDFTPDSKQVTFHTAELRVETWDIATRSRASVYEPVVAKGCVASVLASDGKTLACISPKPSLLVIDVPSGNVLLENRSFTKPETQTLRSPLFPRLQLKFSPDGRFLVASNALEAFGFDVREKSGIKLRGGLSSDIGGGFAFLGNDRVAARNIRAPDKTVIMEFPSGKRLSEVQAGNMPFTAPTRGDYLILYRVAVPSAVRSAKENDPTVLGLFDLDSQRVIVTDRRFGFDVDGDVMARELRDGTIGLYQTKTKALLSQVRLPGSDLGGLRVVSVSPDLKWFAVSERDRGAVWSLADGSQLYLLRGFDGASFPGDGFLCSYFPKDGTTERAMVRLNLFQTETVPAFTIQEPEAWQYGRFLLVKRTNRGGDPLKPDVTYDVRDARNGQTVWSRRFPKGPPRISLNGVQNTLALCWSPGNAIKTEVADYPAVAGRMASAKDLKWDYFVESFDLETGKLLGATLIDTGKGSFAIPNLFAVDDWLVLNDNQNEVLLYSLATGEKKGEVPGSNPLISTPAGLLSVMNGNNEITLYDLSSMEQIDHYTFLSPVVLHRFSADGARLLVITADQTAYFLDVSSTSLASAQTAK